MTLKVEGLRKRFGKKLAVREVSFSMESGEIVGLLGPNGAGKTTVFYMIAGFLRPNAGKILLDEKVITRFPMYKRARAGIAYLPQEPSVFRKLSVEDNIRAILETRRKLNGKARKERLEQLLEELGITRVRKQKAYTLSGGERRRVEIARALATSPKFILLDEPFAGVDPIAVIEIQKIIGFLKQRGIGVVITDHNVRETLGICDRAYIINEGTVLAYGTPDEIVSNEGVRRVYLGEHFRL